MSDEKSYTNADLAMADELLVAAGHPEIAKALRFQTQGNRNLIQGEWGMRVVDAFENILNIKVVAVLASVQQTLDQQHDLVQQILASQKASEEMAQQALTVSKENGRGLKKVQAQMRESQADRKQLHSEVENVRSDVAALRLRIDDEFARRLAALEARADG